MKVDTIYFLDKEHIRLYKGDQLFWNKELVVRGLLGWINGAITNIHHEDDPDYEYMILPAKYLDRYYFANRGSWIGCTYNDTDGKLLKYKSLYASKITDGVLEVDDPRAAYLTLSWRKLVTAPTLHKVSSFDPLPKGYTRVEYIENTGTTAYIKTGVIAANNVGLYIDAAHATTDNAIVIGSKGPNNSRLAIDYNRGTFCLDWNSFIYSDKYNTNTRYEVSINLYNKGVHTINGILKATISGNLNSENDKEIYMFKGNWNGTAAYPFKGKIYRARITLGDLLIRDFIPCINPEKVAGFYDTIEGKFYSNASSGTLIGG